MEGADDLYKSRWASKLVEYRLECSSVHSIECLGEIDEEQVEVLVLLDTFFLELPDSKDHIHRDLCFLKPHWLSDTTSSNVCLVIRFSMIRASILPAMLRRLILRWLSQDE